MPPANGHHVENSIRHGIFYRQERDGWIRINFFTDKQYLVCTIEDNGVGRKAGDAMQGGGQALSIAGNEDHEKQDGTAEQV